GLWFFDGPGSITFGTNDPINPATDTVTFVDGVLSSIDFDVDTTFTADGFGTPVTWTGSLIVSGADISYQINDAQPLGFFGNATLVADITGTVNAVPEPGLAAIASMLGLGLLRCRRSAD
ncbi:MAG: hypothetical protein AAF916_13090, partial [Planctomycetota bacterium]